MKLFTKYNRVNLLATIMIFILASVAFFITLRYILLKQVDEDLKIEQHEIETSVKEHGVLPEPIPVKDQKISYQSSHEPGRREYSTIGLYDSVEKMKTNHRVLVFPIQVNGKYFEVTVAKSLERTDDLIRSILLITVVTILLILAASLVINGILLKRLWRPFYRTLDMVRDFRVDKDQELTFASSHIDEFVFMDQTLERSTSQARRDYLVLKEFTENASHEMQTPLAIIRSKLDLFIQAENLSEEQSKTMQGAYSAVEKLSRLNQSLLLLAKIENNQFAATSTVNLRHKLEEKLEAFHELWHSQNISVTSSIGEAAVNMNEELADILLNNLLSNATRHNFPGGAINIALNDRQLTITNSSHQSQLNGQFLFSRFYTNDGKGSNGLGLSIMRQICENSNLQIRYSFENGNHSFTFSF